MQVVRRVGYVVGLGIALFASFLSACAPPAMAPAATPGATATPTAAPTRLATLAAPPASTPERVIMDSLTGDAREWSVRARQDLVDRLKASADGVRLIKAQEMQWSDSSLGCPEPGMMYAQVITPGYQIVLEYDGAEFDYRVGSDRMMLCEPKK